MKKSFRVILLSFVMLFFVSCANNRNNVALSDKVIQQKYYHKYGLEVTQEDWAYRGKQGKIISKMGNGVVVTRTYVAGLLDGDTTYTFPHSDVIELMLTFSQGALNREVVHYPSGVPQREISYKGDDCRLVTEWYEFGGVKGETTYSDKRIAKAVYYDISGKEESRVTDGEGLRINKDAYGLLLSKDEIQDGKLVKRTTFYSNGNPKEIIPYEEDRINGLVKTFFPAGEPNTLEEWEDDVRHGLTIAYQNGEKIREINYIHGIKEGEEKGFRDGDVVVQTVQWKENKKHGPSCHYLDNETCMEWFYQNQKVAKNTYEWLVRVQGR